MLFRSVKELHLHPELNLSLAKEKIVIFMLSGYERFDFVNREYFEHIHFETMWPWKNQNVPQRLLWDSYSNHIWSDRVGIIEMLLSIAEVKMWCKANDAKLVLTSAFRPEYSHDYFYKTILEDCECNGGKTPNYLLKRKDHVKRLVNIIDWKTYLKPNGERFQRFLKKNGLENIQGANQVLNDVIDDRVSEEVDGVVTFETFKYFESSEFRISSMKECLYKAIEKSTLSQEKILADFYDTNLSSINVVDSDKHRFNIEDWEGDKKQVVIYSEEEYEVIRNNFMDFLFDEISQKKIDVENFEIELSKLIDKELFKSNLDELLTKNKTCDMISSCLGEDWDFDGSTENHFIWIKI